MSVLIQLWVSLGWHPPAPLVVSYCFTFTFGCIYIHIHTTHVCAGPEDVVGGIRLYILNREQRKERKSAVVILYVNFSEEEDNDGRSSPGFLSLKNFFFFPLLRSGKVHIYSCNELDDSMWPFHYIHFVFVWICKTDFSQGNKLTGQHRNIRVIIIIIQGCDPRRMMSSSVCCRLIVWVINHWGGVCRFQYFDTYTYIYF